MARTPWIFIIEEQKNGVDSLTADEKTDQGWTAGSHEITITMSILGTWTNTCRQDSDQYSQEIFVFNTDNTFTWTQNLHSSTDTTCSLPTEIGQKFVKTGTYTAGEDSGSAVTTANNDAKNIDLTMTKFEVTVNAGSVSYFNTNSLWGFTDWAADTAKDVTDKAYNSSTPAGHYLYVKAGDVRQEVYYPNGTQQLVVGGIWGYESLARPTTIGEGSGSQLIYRK